MRTRNQAGALAVLFFVLFSVTHAIAARKTVVVDGRQHALSVSKAVPNTLNYQGFLIDATDSSAVSATLEMTFRLFDSETKGTELWSETHPAVEVSNGLFQVLLGSVTPFPGSLFDGSALWLQTEVGAEAFLPRKPLVSVAYSQKAEQADQATSANWATEAQHAIYADTADYTLSAGVWTVDGDNVYRETGRVGIGTVSPLTELDVSGSVNATTYYGDGSNLTGIGGTTDNDWTISGDDVYHETGKVGIGTSTPYAGLHVKGSGWPTAFIFAQSDSGKDAGIRLYSGDNVKWHMFNTDTFDDALRIAPEGNYASGGITVVQTGDVGIGTTSPGAGLHVKGTGWPQSFVYVQSDQDQDAGFRILEADTAKWHIFNSSGDDDALRIYNSDGSKNVFYAEQDDGDVGIGTTSPAAKLEVRGATGLRVTSEDYSYCYGDFIHRAGSGGLIINSRTGGSWADISFQTNGVTRMFMEYNGDVGIGTTSPAGRLHVDGNGGTGIYSEGNPGVRGMNNSTSNCGYLGTNNYGVYGYNASGLAGCFGGHVYITGNLSKGGGSFVIDHPLDPENKLLRHNFVESPENLLIYRGKVQLDAGGEAMVKMPDYFSALTKEDEATVNLTPIGRSESQERFEFSYEWRSDHRAVHIFGEPGREVAWIVMADRDDPVIHQLARPVEENKGPDNELCDRGELLYPEAYGYPESMGKDYKERKEMERLEGLNK